MEEEEEEEEAKVEEEEKEENSFAGCKRFARTTFNDKIKIKGNLLSTYEGFI